MKKYCLFFRMGALIDVKGDHVEIAPMSSSIPLNVPAKCKHLDGTSRWAHTGCVSIFAGVTWLSPEVSFSLILNFYIKIAISISKMGTHEAVVWIWRVLPEKGFLAWSEVGRLILNVEELGLEE